MWNMSPQSLKRWPCSRSNWPPRPWPQMAFSRFPKMMSMGSPGRRMLVLLHQHSDKMLKCGNVSTGVRWMETGEAPWAAQPLTVFYDAYYLTWSVISFGATQLPVITLTWRRRHVPHGVRRAENTNCAILSPDLLDWRRKSDIKGAPVRALR